MTGKSRYGKGKRSTQGKKKRGRQHFPAAVTQQPTATQTPEPATRPTVSSPSASMPTRTAKPAAVHYPYIAAELRTISILAGTMLIILAVLFFALP